MKLDIRITGESDKWRLTIEKDTVALPVVELAKQVVGGLTLPVCNTAPPRLDTLAGKSPKATDIQAAGGYLFDCLLGERWAEIIKDVGDGAPIDIELHFGDAEDSLLHLPWEAMRTTSGSLLADKTRRVTLIRRVTPKAGAANTEMTVPLPLTVLFVVGAPLDDTDIRAGSEYLCIVDRLAECKGAKVHVLLDASPAKLEEAIQRTKPTVVHFVAHGDVEAGRPYLKVHRDKATDEEPRLFGENLVQTLQWRQDDGSIERPKAVVLSACHTGANAKRVQLEAPLAAQLVSAGVPLAVGMGGRIGDQTCRMFARRFYEGLLCAGPVAAAATDGRLAALRGGVDPDRSLDWARPALFVAEGLREIRIVESKDWQSTRDAMHRYRRFKDPSVFCGRFPLRQQARDFLRTGICADGPCNVLAIVSNRPGEDRYGLSRTLERIMLDAIEDSWIPVDIIFQDGPDQEQRPKTQDDLRKALWVRIRKARDIFGVAQWDSALVDLDKSLAGDLAAVAKLPALVQVQLRDGEALESPRVFHAALIEDLRALSTGAGNRRPVVFLDDIHQYGDATRVLLRELLDADGIGRLADNRPIPVVLSGSRDGDTEYASGREALNHAIQQKRTIDSCEIGAFKEPGDLLLAYRVRLLACEPPMVAVEEREEEAFKRLHVFTKGIPSRFRTSWLTDWLESVRGHFFNDASDDDLLKTIATAGSPTTPP